MTQIDESVQLNDDALRCPQCGKRISATMSACPACGYELLPHRARINCKRCGSRIPAEATKCPRCDGDPRAGRIPSIAPRIVLVVVLLLLILCVGWVVFRAVTTNVLARAFQTSEPTRVPATIVHVIYVVATSPPPSATLPPPATPTIRVTPSPTRRGARTTPTIVVATPTPNASYPTVPLLAPAHTTVYTGANAVIVLEWQSVAPNGLRENEWYEVRLTYTARDGTLGDYRRYSKETRWTVPNELYQEVSSTNRMLTWNVQVVRADGVDPLPTLNRVYVSPAGAPRAFIWN